MISLEDTVYIFNFAQSWRPLPVVFWEVFSQFSLEVLKGFIDMLQSLILCGFSYPALFNVIGELWRSWREQTEASLQSKERV